MNTESYYILNIRHKKDSNASESKIYESLTSVRHLNIPFIPLKSKTTPTTLFNTSNKTTNYQIALPKHVSHMAVFDMVKTVNDELDVTLVGEQTLSPSDFAVDPRKYGTTHFILGEKYEGLA